MPNNNVFVKKIIVHILDRSAGMPVLSEAEHPLDEDINQFMIKRIMKALQDPELKEAKFNKNSSTMILIKNTSANIDNFCSATKEIANLFYEMINQHSEIPSGDLVCCLYYFNDIKHLGIFKFNYRSSYIHFVNNSDKGIVNSIIKQKTALPSINQKVQEAILINLTDYNIKMIERKYLIDDENKFYISPKILKCSSDISDREKIKIFNKVTKKIINNCYEEDYSILPEIKNEISKDIEKNNELNIGRIAEKFFKDSPDIKEEYISKIEEEGIKGRIFKVNEKLNKQNFKKQKMITDAGIEIQIPLENFNNKEKLEFINNPDGTISIIIKNIKQISHK